MAGLSPNLRLVGDDTPSAVNPKPAFEDEDVIVEIDESGGGDSPEMDANGDIMTIEHDDGSITITTDGSPLVKGSRKGKGDWFDNLADDLDDQELGTISDTLLRGINADIESRRDWIDDYATGIKLLGIKLDMPGMGGVTDGAPVEGMSKVRHPLLLEAVLRFQANASAELMPSQGPVKIRVDDTGDTFQDDRLADSLEQDMNHYLTAVATEYYPDTDRMLLKLGFSGMAFKKVYFCPMRNRPVSESVDVTDLIVNNATTDLRNATRLTHRIMMRPSIVRRMQILGAYRDIQLHDPVRTEPDAAQRADAEQQGISIDGTRPEDMDREIYECYCELDIKGYEHEIKGKPSGLPIPYRVTIDVSSRQILSIVRNYEQEDADDLPDAREVFVAYTFVPGLGFYGIGLLHILGNTTNAITAAWREMLDAGMFANFPGFLMADSGARQNTNIFRVPPGGGALVKTGGLPIQQAIMPLPYKEPGPAMMQLVENIAQTGMRVGGTAESQVAEGRGESPVGTVLAQIEQAQKILNAVHKRCHASQAREFQLLVKCFREHPKSFWQQPNKFSYPWDEEVFMKALDNCELVPQADPNTASHTQRLAKVMALKQVQGQNPGMYNPRVVDTAVLEAIGWSNPEQFFAPEAIASQPTPEAMKQQADAQAKMITAQAAASDAQTRAKQQEISAQVAMGTLELQKAKEADSAEMKRAELKSKAEDRTVEMKKQLIDAAQNLIVHPESAGLVRPLIIPALQDVEAQEREQHAALSNPSPGLGPKP